MGRGTQQGIFQIQGKRYESTVHCRAAEYRKDPWHANEMGVVQGGNQEAGEV